MKRILVIILIVVLVILLIKTLSQEDDWICVDNDWIKHGYPSAPKPTEPCGTIGSFEECIAAGHPAMESYPRQCRANGQTFVEDILIGGQRDEHGCLGPAGYLWNETLESCVRQWEIDERNYTDTDEEACKRIQLLCVEGHVPFSDSTGCGCQLESAVQIDVCKPENREANACIEIYQPVCGRPINQTFSNSCFACMDENVVYYTGGECP